MGAVDVGEGERVAPNEDAASEFNASDRSDLQCDPVDAEKPKSPGPSEYEPSEGLGEADGDVHDELHEEFEEGTTERIALRLPPEPSERERREHAISHLPYRSWCRDCVRGKGLTTAHRKRNESEDKADRKPLVAMDYFYLGRDESKSLPILAMVEERTGRTYAISMPEKGVGHKYNIAAAAKVLKVSGCLDAILKSDTERSLVALRTQLQGIFPSLGFEDATKGESQSNGLVESYIGKIEAQARTMKSALDRHYPGLHARHPVLAWMVDYAGALLLRFNRGADGRTPFERSTGKSWRVQLPEFGESVLFQPLKGERSQSKLDPKFEEGIFLGIQEGSALKWVGTPTGVQRAWSIKTRAGHERWDQALMQCLVGLPWQLRPKREEVESRRESLPADLDVRLPADVPQSSEPAVKRKKGYVPRGIYIRRDVELEEFGYTEGCDGCASASQGLSHKQHSSVCKKRIRDELMKSDEGRRRVERMEARAERFMVKFKEEEEKAAKAEKRQAEEGDPSPGKRLSRAADGPDVVLDDLVVVSSEEGNDPQRSAPSTLLTPLPAESGRGVEEGKGGMAPMELANDEGSGRAEGAQRSMDLGSLRVLSLDKGSEDFQGIIREADYIEAQSLMDDEQVESSRICLQLGGVGVREAYGVDPYGRKPVVAEVFSPPRVTHFGMQRGLIAGVALDLTTTDADGNPWDFNKEVMRQKAMELIDELQPELIIGCPPCGPYSILQGLNQERADPAVVQSKLGEARRHLEFCTQLYEQQMQRGKLFLHEHPNTARSWREPCIQRICEMPFVQRITGDMCRQGMVGQDEHGVALVKKPTGYMTNSKCIAQELSLRCENRPGELQVWRRLDLNAKRAVTVRKGGPRWEQVVRRVTMDVDNHVVLQDLRDVQNASQQDLFFTLPTTTQNIETIFYYKAEDSKWHRHVQLINGRAKKAEVYPEGLIRSILKGVRREMEKKVFLGSLAFGPVNEEADVDPGLFEAEDWSTFLDEVSGKSLNTSKVRAARAEEIEFARRYNVWTLAPIAEAWERTGKPPIGCRWIDIDKGDAERPNYRSRLVIQEVRTSGIEAIFAATPPLESIRFLLSLQRSGKKKQKIMFVDIRRAHWTAKIDRLVYVRLPEEASKPGFCGRLNRAMYGCRDAARQWEIEITDFFTVHGFTPGLGSPVLFVSQTRDVKVSVHGDDITALGEQPDLEWLKCRLLERYEIKFGGLLGPDEGDVQDAMILNRLVHYGATETTYEADPRHVQILVNELGLQDAKPAPTPGVRRSDSEATEPLSEYDMRRFRSLVMRCNFLSLDRPDVAYASKELARAMSTATNQDWNGLKRLVRYLKGVPRLVWSYTNQSEQDGFSMFTE